MSKKEDNKPKEVLKHRVKNFVFRGGDLVTFVIEGKEDPKDWIAVQDVIANIKAGQSYEAVIDGKTVDLKVNKIDNNPEYVCTSKSNESLDKLIPRIITEQDQPAGKNPDGTEKAATEKFKANPQVINT